MPSKGTKQHGRIRASTPRRSKDTASPSYHPAGDPVSSSLAQNARIYFFSYDPRLKVIVSSSNNALDVLGVREAELQREGNLFLRYVHPRDRFALLASLEGSLAGLNPYLATYRWVRPDTGEARWLHCRAGLTKDGDRERFDGIIFEAEDFRDSGRELALLDSLESVFLILDSDLTVVYRNEFTKRSGFDFGDPQFDPGMVMPGQPLERSFADPARWQAVKEEIRRSFERAQTRWAPVIAGQRSFQIDTSLFIDDSNDPLLVIHARDVSELSSARSDLAALSRAASFQVVANGVMHNVNNGLQAIITETANLIESRMDPDSVRARGEKLMKLTHRIAALTHELIALGGDAATTIDLNLCVMNALAKARDFMQPGTELEISFATSALCYGSPESVLEIIESLLKTAWQEFQPAKTTLRTVSVSEGSGEKVILSAELRLSSSNKPSGERLQQMAQAVQRISPLIVALVEPGKVRFILTLDRVFSEDEAAPVSSVDDPEVLVVDDEPMVAETITALLNREGLKAVHITSAQNALQILRSNRSIKVVLTDALMPDLRGSDFVRRVKRRFPELTVLGFSGSPSELRPLKDAGAVEVILKPVDPVALISIVSKYVKPLEKQHRSAGNL